MEAADSDDVRGARDRVSAIPNANSPQLLTHLLELTARGLRTGRGLQEALGVDGRTVRYYVQAAVWLGFLRDEPDPVLTPEGLAYVYGGARRRPLWAEAVEQQPFVARLRDRHGGVLPAGEALEEAIAQEDPSLAPSTVARRASALRGLVAPWRDERAADALAGHEGQLSLPLPQGSRPTPAPELARLAGAAFSPDIYRWTLSVLLDHGELTLGHVRALLDRAGAQEAPIGAYVDLAEERGDATRMEDRLVASSAAVSRRDLCDSTVAIILSDAGWRAHVEQLRADPRAAPGRWRPWDLRLLGRPLDGATVEADLASVLRDRSLGAWPSTQAPATPPALPTLAERPFLDAIDETGLLVALPPSLAHLWEGVSGINRRLRNARHRTDAVALPTLAYRPARVHGGLLYPGEALPRAIADGRSLRHRVLTHAPYLAMAVALLLTHRQSGHPQLVRHRDDWWVTARRHKLGPLLEVLDGFAVSRGWIACRRRTGGLSSAEVVSLLERLGVAVLTRDRVLLDDAFFHQLRVDEEEQQVAARLEPLRVAVEAWIDRAAHL